MNHEASAGRRVFLRWLGGASGVVLLGCPESTPGGTADAVSDALADLSPDTVVAPDTPLDLAPDTAIDVGLDTAVDLAPEVAELPPVGSPTSCIATTEDATGPFYLEDAPITSALAAPDEPGDRMLLRGRVWTMRDACAVPLTGVTVELWQADAVGAYFDEKLRIRIETPADGTFAVDTIKPGPYLQATGWRPAHIHMRIAHPTYDTFVTQLYFAGDPYLAPNDSCGGCASGDPKRWMELTTSPDGVLLGTVHIVLA